MTDSDRIAVPTNGHRKRLAGEDETAVVTAPPTSDAAPTKPETEERGLVIEGADMRIAFTPGQLAAGLGIVAGVILLVMGSRRRGGRGK